MKKTVAVLLLLILLTGYGYAEASGGTVKIPEINIARKEIPENDALALVREMKAGWNLGNSFDANGCIWLKNKMDYESGWCRVKASEKLIEAVRTAGFNTIRIPVSWHDHLSGDWTIDEDWLNRVYEVASWVYDRGMYVIINIHHDEKEQIQD